jgi:cellulose synthase/poly-beta-1,6-N-acetylglucosamine synthase-like glycosyltransferase
MLQTLIWIAAIPIAAVLLIFNVRRLLFLLAILPGSHPKKKISLLRETYLPTVLILVPCREEVTMIPGMCQSLSQLDYPSEKLQVVLIDDGSMDGTGQAMEQQAAGRPGWQVLKFASNVGKAHSMNRALERFPFGEIVYVFDADHRPNADVIRRAARYFYAPRVAAVTGLTKVLNPLASPSAFYATVESYVNQLVTMRAKDRLGLAPALLGSNCAYRREPLIACGGFRDGALSEDSDLTVTFYRAGYQVRFMEDAVSHQRVPQSLDGYLKQHIRWGRGLNDVARVHSLKLLSDRRLPLALRLELLLFTAGYLDRLALMSAVLLVGLSYFLGNALVVLFWIILFSLAMPLVQIVVLFLKERMNPAMWLRLPLIPLFFLLDIFAAIRSMLDTLLNQPRVWTRTQREEIP